MTQSYLDGLLLGRPEDDEASRGARLASAFFVGASVVVLASVPLLPPEIGIVPVTVLATVGVACGLVIPRLPWTRWGTRPLVLLPVLGYALLGLLGLSAPGALNLYMPLYMLTFVYLGLVAKPGTPLRMAAVAVASYLFGNLRTVDLALIRLFVSVPIWLLIGETLARTLADRTAQMRRVADTDGLTQLDNRRGYDRTLETVGDGDAVIVVDLDYFKAVNDCHGHPVGDDALRHLAEAMRAVTRRVDTVARIGGDEFAMILARAGVLGAQEALHRLREQWEDRNAVTTFSAGIAIHHTGECPQATLARADESLYRAKDRGRARVEISPRDIVLAPSLTR